MEDYLNEKYQNASPKFGSKSEVANPSLCGFKTGLKVSFDMIGWWQLLRPSQHLVGIPRATSRVPKGLRGTSSRGKEKAT